MPTEAPIPTNTPTAMPTEAPTPNSTNTTNATPTEVNTTICHPGAARVQVSNGDYKELFDLQTDDLVRTPSGFKKVIAVDHVDPDVVELYVRIRTDTFSMAISPSHHMIVNGEEKDPRDAAIGEKVTTINGEEEIRDITYVRERGAYAFFLEGSDVYFVDGILASVYVSSLGIPRRLYWLCPQGYFQIRYNIGVPFSGKGLATYRKISEALRDTPLHILWDPISIIAVFTVLEPFEAFITYVPKYAKIFATALHDGIRKLFGASTSDVLRSDL
eukprot:TRINITY_DN13699_c0_g3_i1.p1 TRINITY_DN13699_c0_g3~~TRINITY_DN13699_c0_g3_i1.p1  ORF type:complete len:298 (-),score=23.87 TRINITY_DN13699_c0_g3_i1:132-950(-)